jgi:anti-anti-sigma regulatory factor
MAILIRVGEFGYSFATRARGSELREEVLEQTLDHQAVILDFTDVTNVSYSFADEFVGKLACERPEGMLELTNMSQTVGDTVRRAQQRRASAIPC